MLFKKSGKQTFSDKDKRYFDRSSVLFDNMFKLIAILWIRQVKPINCELFAAERVQLVGDYPDKGFMH